MSGMLPKINFLNIGLQGGYELDSKSSNPYVIRDSDSGQYRELNLADDSDIEPMSVMLTMMVQAQFGANSNLIYSSFFKNDFSKFLKIKVIQSTNPSISDSMISNPHEWFAPGGKLEKTNSPHITVVEKQLTSFEGESPELSKDYGNSVEIKYINGNKVYCFPYSYHFQVPISLGGTSVDHLAYFAYACIDVKSLAEENNISYDKMINQKFVKKVMYGSVSMNVAVQNGQTKNLDQVFFVTPVDSFGNPIPFRPLRDSDGNIIGNDYSTTSIWTGKVHYHGPENPGPNGYVGYMAGESGADMGPFLTPVGTQNNLVQDFRKYKDIEKLDLDYSLFSNRWFNQQTSEQFRQNIKGLKKNNTHNIKDIEKLIIKSSSEAKEKSIFGDIYTTIDASGNTRFSFSLDIEQAIVENTLFPALATHLFNNGSPEDIRSVLNRKIIADFKLFRTRVHRKNSVRESVNADSNNTKLIVSTSEQQNGMLKIKSQKSGEASRENGTIKQINLDLPLGGEYNATNIRFYTGTDLEIPNDGEYVYSIELSMIDPIINWMRGRVQALEAILYGDNSYSNYVVSSKSEPAFYNLYTNRFTQDAIGVLNSEYGSGFSHNLIRNFFYILDKFSFFKDNKQREEIFLFMSTVSSVEHGNPTGVDIAFKIMETFYNKILKIFSSASKYKKPIDSLRVESQYSAGSNPSKVRVIKHKFNSIVRANINHLTGYDYLSLTSTLDEDMKTANGLKNISASDYELRVSQETNKLFPDAPVPSSELEKSSTNIAIYRDFSPNGASDPMNPADSINFTKYGYLSPSIINFGKDTSHNLLNNGKMQSDTALTSNALTNIIKANLENNKYFDNLNGNSVKNSKIAHDRFSLLEPDQVLVKTKEGKDILSSNTGVDSLMLATMYQKYFDILSDLTWAWAYYTNPIHVYKEFKNWTQFNNKIKERYKSTNSPLKRAPNHIKALFLHLNQMKDLKNPAFESLMQFLQELKPKAYGYLVSQDDVAPHNPLNYLTFKEEDGTSRAVPKNKVLYQTPEFVSFFLLNYKNIVKVEFLLGYNGGVNNPVWEEMTFQAWQTLSARSGNIMCRIRPYENNLYGVKRYSFLDLPIYNDHFIINFGVKGEYSPSVETISPQRAYEVNINGKSTLISPLHQNQSFSRTVAPALPSYNRRKSDEMNQGITETGVYAAQGVAGNVQAVSAPETQIADSATSNMSSPSVSTTTSGMGSY